ncbi:beta-ketoacyl synthase [Flavobacterium sp. NKUCC04_CG]|uniref:beta-ketoacyl-[acyl-carrier-protein] synthase family protein n=1 Tax=Flavobacterium sp. NKUCC04_CG TaxID=2842121 RepID=UPI001C5AD4FB|nr:beta-ketoacyl-[acyl-carrier-protein] synthase family protein [Flavobacterium sp. NKUCC04_CG]MBW3518402.1 beta-ketoacyl-[acyl-carrier-protein] synthase family protein [Flavobacterium sp. NKUCC04_CG]
MQNKIAITGMGIISAIGTTVAENFDALLQGKHGLSRLTQFESIHQSDIFVGEVKWSNRELTDLLELPSEHSFTRTALLGAYAAKRAVESAGIKDINAYKTGLISSTSVGGMDFTEKYFYDYFTDPETQKFISSHNGGDSSKKIANYLGIEELVTTISTACSSAANAVMMGCRLIQSGKLDRVIVGGTDALSKFTVNGFKTLMILSDTHNAPFDQNRKGLNLGEAAAYLVLESDRVIAQENKTVLGYVLGYGNANDAFHQTASSEEGEGAFLAMQKALKLAGLSAAKIDYVNAHGTATGNNDLSEGRALLRIFDNKVPEMSSTKPFTGHTLAAAGGIEAVFSLLALENQVVYPNLNFKTPMEEFNLIPQTRLIHKPINYILSNSFGFGGNCSTLIFSKY